MKKGKIIALFLSILLVITVLTPAAYALDMSGLESLWGIIGGGDVNSTGLDGILDSIFGGGNSVNISDFLGGLMGGGGLDKIRELLGGAAVGTSDSDLLSAITALLGGNSAVSADLFNDDFLGMLKNYLSGENVTTTEPETTEPVTVLPKPEETTTEQESTTAPAATEPHVTEPTVTVPPTTVYAGGQTYPTVPYVPTTSVYETSTYYQYVPQYTQTVSELVPTNFSPTVYDNDDAGVDEGISAKMVIGILILLLSGAAVIVVGVVLKKSRI